MLPVEHLPSDRQDDPSRRLSSFDGDGEAFGVTDDRRVDVGQ